MTISSEMKTSEKSIVEDGVQVGPNPVFYPDCSRAQRERERERERERRRRRREGAR